MIARGYSDKQKGTDVNQRREASRRVFGKAEGYVVKQKGVGGRWREVTGNAVTGSFSGRPHLGLITPSSSPTVVVLNSYRISLCMSLCISRPLPTTLHSNQSYKSSILPPEACPGYPDPSEKSPKLQNTFTRFKSLPLSKRAFPSFLY